MGGYFICNGIERIIRMLIQQRRHYIMALRRSAYHKRGNNYTDAATLIRCACLHALVFQIMFAEDESSAQSHTAWKGVIKGQPHLPARHPSATHTCCLVMCAGCVRNLSAFTQVCEAR